MTSMNASDLELVVFVKEVVVLATLSMYLVSTARRFYTAPYSEPRSWLSCQNLYNDRTSREPPSSSMLKPKHRWKRAGKR